jgi:TonB family protein
VSRRSHVRRCSRYSAIVVAAVVCGGAAPHRVRAQSAPSCPAIKAGAPYERCQVDRPPRADSTNAAPEYVTLLRNVAVAGVVRLQFTIDASGRPQPASLVAVGSAHPMLVSAATAAVKAWTFEPALRGSEAVAVRYEQIVRFVSSLDPDAPELDVPIQSRDTTSDGVPRLTVGTPERDPGAILRFSNEELFAAQRAVLLALAPEPIADSTGKARVVMCLSRIRGGQEEAADDEMLRALTLPGRRAVIPRDCPQPFTGRLWDATRAPPGWIDPYIMTPVHLDAWTHDVLIVDVIVDHASVAREYRCSVARSSSGWRPKCIDTSVRPG